MTQSSALHSFIVHNRESKAYLENFYISKKDLAELAKNGSRAALIQVFRTFLKNVQDSERIESVLQDEEVADELRQAQATVMDIIQCLEDDEKMTTSQNNTDAESETSESLTMNAGQINQMEQNMEFSAAVLAVILLKSDPNQGISDNNEEILHRMRVFGSNTFTKKKMKSYLVLCWEALQNFVLIMLLIMATITISVETTIGLDEGEKCNGCWLESVGIFLSVLIVVNVSAGIDYMKQFAFKRLSESLDETNKKCVIRNGEHVIVTDAGIVVGEILSVNSHSLATVPADCVLLGSANDIRVVDESSLTGESNAVRKKPGDVVLSGTNAVEGSGSMVVIAVGVHSVAGRIKAHVYECEESDHVVGDTRTPLYTKIDKLAKQIAVFGTVAAVSAFILSTSIGLSYHKVEEAWTAIIDYFVVAVTVLAVAVPEGLPLAVVLALAFSSNKMMDESNMVKSLDACETMGCATMICTDKTGTLTANRMAVRAIFTSQVNYTCTDPKLCLSQCLLRKHETPIPSRVTLLIATAVAICTMNETSLLISDGKVQESFGNPTEVALLTLVHDMGYDYRRIRSSAPGRTEKCNFNATYPEGKLFNFTSSRKMMSWAIPLQDGGYRLYSKGAGEVILARCAYEVVNEVVIPLNQASINILTAAMEQYSKRGMRCLGIAYRDLPPNVNLETKTDLIRNSDGTEAFAVESDLIFCAFVGIEDPLRPEVPDAINKCYEAGIDVRLVTGDNPNSYSSEYCLSGRYFER